MRLPRALAVQTCALDGLRALRTDGRKERPELCVHLPVVGERQLDGAEDLAPDGQGNDRTRIGVASLTRGGGLGRQDDDSASAEHRSESVAVAERDRALRVVLCSD